MAARDSTTGVPIWIEAASQPGCWAMISYKLLPSAANSSSWTVASEEPQRLMRTGLRYYSDPAPASTHWTPE
jgi:hypothetical protein